VREDLKHTKRYYNIGEDLHAGISERRNPFNR